MRGPVDVVAVGARTPVGLTAESAAAAVRAGVSRYAEFPFVDARGEPVVVAADPRLDPTLEGRRRLVPMILSVVGEVREKLARGYARDRGFRLLLALPEARPGFTERDAAWVVDHIRDAVQPDGAEARVELAGRGHAGAIRAVQKAAEHCAEFSSELAVVVGADSYMHGDTFAWLEGHRRFAQPGVRGGFAPGEGAGALVLAGPALRERLLLPRLASVRGVGVAVETQLRDSDVGSFGVGMTQAVEAAIAGLDLPREAVDVLYADINGERYRSEEWGFVALRTPLAWKSYVYEAPGDCWGDVGAAFGALAAVLAVQSYARRYQRGPRSLVIAGSDGGLRAAMLLQDPQLA